MIMKSIFRKQYHFTCLLALILGLNMASCVDNNENDPPVKDFVPGKHITIALLKAMYNDELAKTDYKTRVPVEITEELTIKGIITTDDNLNGNLYKEAYIEDASAGLLMKLNTTGALNMGDSVMVNLKGLYLGDYGNFIQMGSAPYTDNSGNLRVSNIDVDECMSRFSFLNETTPTEVTISVLKTNLDSYLGRLVKIDDVQFADSELGNSYAVPQTNTTEADYGNRKLEDCYKNNIIVRSSGYSTFAADTVAQGNGSIVGIVTKFNTTIQLIIRDINEVKMDGERCGAGENVLVETIDEKFDMVEDEVDIAMRGWKNIIVAGTRTWRGKTFTNNSTGVTEKYAQATAYKATEDNLECWLITPFITVNSAKTFSFESAKSFWAHADGNNPFEVYYSSNFDGTNIAAAQWTKINATTALSSDANNAWIPSGTIDLPVLPTKNIVIGFKYKGSKTETTTIRIDNIVVTNK